MLARDDEPKERPSSSSAGGLRLSSLLRRACSFAHWSPGAKSFGAAFLYFSVSIALTLLNKSVFAVYAFRASRLLALAQMVCSILFLHVFDKFGLITLPRLSWPVAKLCLPLSVSYVAMMICGFDAMRGTNLVMFDTLRRTTIVFVIVVEWWCMPDHPWPSHPVLGTSLLCLVGTLIAGATDLSFDAYGYTMAALTNLSTSLYIVLIRYVKSRAPPQAQLDSFAMLYYNVVLSLPALVVYSVASGDVAVWTAFDARWTLGFQVVFGASAVLGFVINYSVFLNTLVNSPLTQVITGQAKSVGVLALGALLFQDVVFDVTNTAGVLLSVLGGALYAYVKYVEGEQDKLAKARQTRAAQKLEQVAVVSELEAARRNHADATAAAAANGPPTANHGGTAAAVSNGLGSTAGAVHGSSSAPVRFGEPVTPAPAALPPVSLAGLWPLNAPSNGDGNSKLA